VQTRAKRREKRGEARKISRGREGGREAATAEQTRGRAEMVRREKGEGGMSNFLPLECQGETAFNWSAARKVVARIGCDKKKFLGKRRRKGHILARTAARKEGTTALFEKRDANAAKENEETSRF